MARPLSEQKREAILAAATELVATVGPSAPTAKLAGLAHVSEGTLFTYFANKDVLLNQLFLALETELAAALLSKFPTKAKPRKQLEHVWRAYVQWGVANPQKQKALQQLKVSDRISEASKAEGDAAFLQVKDEVRTALLRRLPPGLSEAYAVRMLSVLAEATMDVIASDPEQAAHYIDSGFDLFWKGIRR